MDSHFVERNILRMGSYQINDTFSTALGYDPATHRSAYSDTSQSKVFNEFKREVKRWINFTS